MAYTLADRYAIERALARGEKRVTFGDKTVEYRSVDELRSVLREIDAALAAKEGRVKTRRILVTTSKGF